MTPNYEKLKEHVAPLLTSWQLACINKAVTCTWTYKWTEKRIARYWLELAYKLTKGDTP